MARTRPDSFGPQPPELRADAAVPGAGPGTGTRRETAIRRETGIRSDQAADDDASMVGVSWLTSTLRGLAVSATGTVRVSTPSR